MLSSRHSCLPRLGEGRSPGLAWQQAETGCSLGCMPPAGLGGLPARPPAHPSLENGGTGLQAAGAGKGIKNWEGLEGDCQVFTALKGRWGIPW